MGKDKAEKKEKKEKKEKDKEEKKKKEEKEEKKQEKEEDEEKQRRKWEHVCAIASPLVTKKLNKKALKLVTKAAKNKWQLKRGVKEVTKAVRKGAKGICLLAGDISPIDVISHLPVLCEESDVAYAYVPSREDLGLAAATKRATSVVLVLEKPMKGDVKEEDLKSFRSDYDEIQKEFNELAVAAFKK